MSGKNQQESAVAQSRAGRPRGFRAPRKIVGPVAQENLTSHCLHARKKREHEKHGKEKKEKQQA
jgi:hypothetical protein